MLDLPESEYRWWYVVKKPFKPAMSYHRYTFERGYTLHCPALEIGMLPERLHASHKFRDNRIDCDYIHARSSADNVYEKKITRQDFFKDYLWGPYTDHTMRKGIWYFSGVIGPGNEHNFTLREAGEICSWSWTNEGLLKDCLLSQPWFLKVLRGEECLTWDRISENSRVQEFQIAPVIKAEAVAAD